MSDDNTTSPLFDASGPAAEAVAPPAPTVADSAGDSPPPAAPPAEASSLPTPGPDVPAPGPAGPSPVPDVPTPTPDPAAPPAPPMPEPLRPDPAPEPAPPAPEPAPDPASPAPDPSGAAAAEAPAGETSAADTSADAAAAADTPADTTTATDAPAADAPPAPGRNPHGGRPGGGPGRPGGRRPGGGRPSPKPPAHAAPTAAAVVEPTVEPIDPHLWGRIDDEGVVYVKTGEAERAVGNWQAGDNEAGLAHYGRRFDDFSTEIALLEARLASGSGDPKSAKQQAIALREQVGTLAAIGDLDSAAARLEVVIGAAEQAIAGASQARAQARARAVTAKEALCAEAEQLAESTQWKSTGDRLKAIVDEWRQIHGIDRKTDDALWKRFAKARDTFSRHRGSHFAELDKQRAAAKDVKEQLIKKAEELSNSSEWGETAGAYRDLMSEWKAAGRAPRDVEDSLWERFRAAQEAFFSRRNQVFSERDAEFEANAKVKDDLLVEARKIDPATDLDGARAALRSIQERWEAAGKVPRERIRELDGALRAVEDKVRKAEDSHWKRTDPETQARVDQFRSRVEQFKTQAEKARAAGNERKAKEAEAQAQQWQQWLEAAENAVDG